MSIIQRSFSVNASSRTLTNSPLPGDVLVFAWTHARSSPRTATLPTGAGATWTLVHGGGRTYWWIGTGATSTGLISTTPSGSYSGGAALWHLRGVTTEVAGQTLEDLDGSTGIVGPTQNAGPNQHVLAVALGGGNTVFPSVQTPSAAYTSTGSTDVFGRAADASPSSSAPHRADAAYDLASGITLVSQLVLGTAPAPPGTPTGITATSPTMNELTLGWDAVAGADTYDVRIDGGAPVTGLTDTTYTFGGLDPSSTHTLEVRAVNAAGASDWASIEGTTADDPANLPHLYDLLRIELGPVEDPTLITGPTYRVQARRATDDPGTLLVVVDGATVTPVTDPACRPARPLRVLLAGDPDPLPVMASTIDRARLEFGDFDLSTYRVVLEASDATTDLAKTPAATTRKGTLTQRVDHILADTPIAYLVTDDGGQAPATGLLPTEATDALGQLQLIRDTLHAVLHVDRAGVVQVYGDTARPSREISATFTDDAGTAETDTVIHYTGIEPDYDTLALVNVADVTVLPDSEPVTVIDAASITEWGPARAAMTVNQGHPEYHAARLMAAKYEPKLTATRITFNATLRPTQAALLELGQAIRVVRSGVLDAPHEITAIEHNIYVVTKHVQEIRWVCSIECIPLAPLPITWADVPATITWADVDPALTWTRAAAWQPTP